MSKAIGDVSENPINRERSLFGALMCERFDLFTCTAFRSLHREIQLEREEYLQIMCFALQGVLAGAHDRLLINMPPRTLKSETAAVYLPAFALGLHPNLKIGVVSYSHELGREHTTLFNRLVNQSWYRDAFPSVRFTDLKMDNAVTTRGGGRKSFTVTGGFTGMGVDFLVLDDLIKAQDVRSAPEREAVERFFRETALTRFNDQRKSKIIAIAQRLHPYDLASQLIETGRYHHLNMPAIMSRDMNYPMYSGKYSIPANDLLAPALLPRDQLNRLKLEMGTAAFSAQYLQDPLPDGSTIVDISRLHLVERPFRCDQLQLVALSIDTAVKDTDNCDFSVIATWGFNGERWCLMDVLRARLDFPALVDATRAMIVKWRVDRILIEDTHTGSALWSHVRTLVRQALTVKPEGDKIERMSVCTELLYSGRYVIPKSEPWFDTIMSELRAFPNGRHDDIVDTISQFLGWSRLGREQMMIDTKHGFRRSGRR